MLELFMFYMPLALTHMMMSGGTPIVNAGITRRPDPVGGLAAFAVAFSVSILVNGLCFSVEPAAVAMIKGPSSYRRVLRFSLVLGSVVSLGMFLLAVTPLSDMLFSLIFGLEPHLMKQAVDTLAIFAVLPFMLTLRSFGRGTLISISRTSLVGWGTLLRLTSMTLVSVMGALGILPLPGPILGATAFAAGVFSEMAAVLLGASRYQHLLPGDEADDIGASYKAIFNFAIPIVFSGLFSVAINIAMNSVLSKTEHPSLAVSSFSVVRSIAWFISSMLLAFQQLSIARARSTEDYNNAVKFSTFTILIVTFVLALAAYTPLGYVLMHYVIGVDGDVLEAATKTLYLTPVLPLIIGVRSFVRGTSIRERFTGSVLLASAVSLFAAILVGFAIKDVLSVGAMVAVFMWLSANLAEMLVLLFMRLRAHRKTAGTAHF